MFTQGVKSPKKQNAKPPAVTKPKISSANQQQNFSEKSNIRSGGGSIPTITPPDNISVSKEAPVSPPPTQLTTTTISTKVASISKPLLVTISPKVLCPTLKESPTLKAPSPPPVNRPVPGQPMAPLVIAKSSPLVEEPREKVKRSWSSLVVKNTTTNHPKLIRSDSDSVKARVLESPPLPQDHIPPTRESKPSRQVEKTHQDPKRLRWIARREKLEEKGVDLSDVSVGRKDVDHWNNLSVTRTWHGKNLYVVWNGVKVGCFVGWDKTNTLVKGFRKAGFKKVSSEAEAIETLENFL